MTQLSSRSILASFCSCFGGFQHSWFNLSALINIVHWRTSSNRRTKCVLHELVNTETELKAERILDLHSSSHQKHDSKGMINVALTAGCVNNKYSNCLLCSQFVPQPTRAQKTKILPLCIVFS